MALAACAGTSVALAAPRDVLDMVALNGAAPIESRARINDAGNVTITSALTGTYNVAFLKISGGISNSQGGTWQSEASILCTPPTGTPFIIQPFNQNLGYAAGATTPDPSFTVPLAPIPVAGTWSFQFFDRYDDVAGGLDGQWDSCTITMDDGPAPAGPVLTGPRVKTFASVDCDGLAAAPSFTNTFTLPAGVAVGSVRLSGVITGTGTNPDVNTTISPANNVRIQITDPNGANFVLTPAPAAAASSFIIDQTINIGSGADTGAGNWTVSAFVGFDYAGVDAHISNLQIDFLPITAPDARDIGVVSANADGSERVITETVNIPAAAAVRWLKFRTMSDALADGKYLDIDTEGTATFDTELGVYRASGALVANDDDDGSGLLTALSFGNNSTPRVAIGTGLAGDGRDGELVAGTYYIATGDYNLNFVTGFGVTSTGIDTGDITINFRTTVVGQTVCSVADVGVVGGGTGHDNVLDNNDFVAFINLFFAQDPSADVGVVGGGPGSDGQWDNNDFVAFINFFFNDQANCTG